MVDACSFTELRRTYPRPHFDGVWKLIERVAAEGRLLSVKEVYLELDNQDDEVAVWAKKHRDIFLPLTSEVQLKTREILKSHPTLVDLKKKSGADPFLIAAAILRGATVVTQEKKSGGPPSVKIPDVCAAYGVKCIPLLEFLKAEELST